MNAQIITFILHTAKTLIGFIRDVSENDEVLQGIVDQARQEGREITKQEVQEAVSDMSTEVDRLEILLTGRLENQPDTGLPEGDNI